jgi:hypothetical protein
MSEIVREMGGNEAANYKCIQRFLKADDLQDVLLHMFPEDALFVIGDPTEMPRPQARKTELVGTLSDSATATGCYRWRRGFIGEPFPVSL